MDLYTIGSSILTIDEFVRVLKKFNINALADVRSIPYSKFTPQFNKEALSEHLKGEGILYIPMNEEFGARRQEKEVYTNGQVDFCKTAALPIFEKGIERIGIGINKGYNIALMCTERDPIDCHRFILVARNIENKLKINVNHIINENLVESKIVIERRMLSITKLKPSIFNSNIDELIEESYKIIGSKIAYSEQKYQDWKQYHIQ